MENFQRTLSGKIGAGGFEIIEPLTPTLSPFGRGEGGRRRSFFAPWAVAAGVRASGQGRKMPPRRGRINANEICGNARPHPGPLPRGEGMAGARFCFIG